MRSFAPLRMTFLFRQKKLLQNPIKVVYFKNLNVKEELS